MKHQMKRTAYFALSGVLVVVMLFSSVMTAFAWSDFTQSKTNDFRGTVGKTTVALHKYEKDPEGNIIAHPVANAEFMLYKSNFDGAWTQLGGIYKTNSSGKITVEKLNSGSYKFVEQTPGYEYDKAPGGGDIREYPFTKPGGDEVIISGQKAWNHGGNPIANRPNSITVYIMNGKKTVKEFTVTEADGWRWSAVLPKNDANGNPIRYTVEEGTVPHYTHKVDGHDLINEYKGPDYPGDPGPITGDNSNPWLWTILLIISAILFCAVFLWGMRNRKNGYSAIYYKMNR